MKRVAVFGNAGGGKSTLARHLADMTGLPLYVIDLMQFSEFVNQTMRCGYRRPLPNLYSTSISIGPPYHPTLPSLLRAQRGGYPRGARAKPAPSTRRPARTVGNNRQRTAAQSDAPAQ